MTTSKPALVLVHGAWGGSWVWRRVLAPLRAAGYEVHTVTLTGDGDRAHLRRPDIDLDDHITDVTALVEMEELSRVIIVGHSYGGMVVTGAADRIEAQKPGTVAGLIYVDAMFPIPGEGWGGGHSEEVAAARLALAAANDNALPAPDAREGFNLSEADAAWLNRRQVPHPFGMYRVPLNYDGDVINALPRLFINCNNPAYPTIESIRERVYSSPGWKIDVIPTGHYPMVSEPEALVESILGFADAI